MEDKRPVLVERIESSGMAPIVEDAEITGFKGFTKGYKPMIMSALTVLVINIVFSLFGLLNLAFNGDYVWIGVVLCVLLTAAYIAFLFMSAKNASHTAYNYKRLNDVNIRANRRVPLYKKRMEYHPWKGYIVGLLGSIPLIIVCIISFCLPKVAYDGLAVALRIAYGIFFTPLSFFDSGIHVGILIYGALINALSYGISYQLYGMKMQMQQESIEDDMRRVHGEFDKNGSDKIDV